MPKTAATTEPTEQKKSLFDISRELTEFESIMSMTDALSPEMEDAASNFLMQNEAERDKKFAAMAGVIRRLNSEADFQKAEAKRLTDMAKVTENKVKRIKWMMLNFMQTHNIDAVKTPLGRIRRQTNGSAPVVLSKWAIENPVELNERFRRVIFEANLEEIKQALKDGEELDFASFGEKGEQLRIE